MNPRNDWAKEVQTCEDETAVALADVHLLVQLRLALQGAEHRGGHLGVDNVQIALRTVAEMEKRTQARLKRLRAERGALRRGEMP